MVLDLTTAISEELNLRLFDVLSSAIQRQANDYGCTTTRAALDLQGTVQQGRPLVHANES